MSTTLTTGFSRVKNAFIGSFLLKAITLTIIVGFIATLGFYFIENSYRPYMGEPLISLTDALYWTVATFTTIGYGDVVPVTEIGKLFSIILGVYGATVWAILLVYIITWIINAGKVVRDKKVIIEIDVTKEMTELTFGELFKKFKEEENFILIGVWRDDADMRYFNPADDFKLITDDTLIVVRTKNLPEKLSFFDL